VRGASSSSGSSAGRPVTALEGSSPKRFFASCSALSLVSRSCLRRFSSSALRASAASRSLRSVVSRLLRRSASSSAILRSSASRRRDSPRARARRTLLLGQRAQHHAGRLGCNRRSRRSRGRCLRRRRCRACPLGGCNGPAAGLGLCPRRRPALHLLNDDRLAAAVAETLAHDALLDPASFQGQGLGRGDAELFFASLFRSFNHTDLNPIHAVATCRCGSACPRAKPRPWPIWRSDICLRQADLPRAQPGNNPAARRAKTSRLWGRRARLHVSHLSVLMPNPIAPFHVGAATASAGGTCGAGARSSSLIHPALMRARIISASMSSRDRSKPSRMPG